MSTRVLILAQIYKGLGTHIERTSIALIIVGLMHELLTLGGRNLR